MPTPEEKRKHKTDLERARRHARKASGLCPVCGTSKPEPGYVTCRMCLEVRRTKYRAAGSRLRETALKYVREVASPRYHARKAAGLCPICGNPTDGNHTQCSACHQRFLVYNKRHRDKAKREALEALEALRRD